jgi:hypothetical protein
VTFAGQGEEIVPTRRAVEILRIAEERLKTAEGKLRAFIERPDRQYSPEERAENKRLLDDLRLAMVEYSEAFKRAARP